MAFINNEELKDRLEKDNLLSRLVPKNGKPKPIQKIVPESEPEKNEFEVELSGGNGKRGPGLPAFLQEIIGTLGNQENQRGVAKAFGVSQGRVSQLSNGHSGTNVLMNEDLKSRVDNQMKRVRDRAVDKLMDAMGLMSDEKMEDEDAKDLSIIAANMSKVVTSTLPKEDSIVNQQQIIIYAPETQTAEFYEVKEIE